MSPDLQQFLSPLFTMPAGLGPEWLLIFLLVGLGAGTVDAIAGGGGLIVIPVLLSAGLAPTSAIATNKVGSVAGSLAATVHFTRIGQLDLRQAWPLWLGSFIGALFGCWLLVSIDNALLKDLIPGLLIAFALYFLFSPNVGRMDRSARMPILAYGLAIAPAIGFYDGFFGPGTGAFFAISFVLLLGHNLVKATAHAKLLNFASNLASVLWFLVYGQIVWPVGLALLAGQFVGGSIGARLAVRSGQRLIRVVMVVMSIAMSLKLLLQP